MHLVATKKSRHIFCGIQKPCTFFNPVSISSIFGILGHVDIKTTEIYARADTEMKRKALEQAYPTPVPETGSWQSDSKLMDWLKSLSP